MEKLIHFIKVLKKNYISLLMLFFMFSLLIFANSNIVAVKKGLYLFYNNVIPSLLPFFIATEMLFHTNIINQFEYILNPIMRPLFNVSGAGAFALIMGIISGYPVGAKIATNFRNSNICSKEECERLLSFTNNSGPLFILGTVGIGLFGNVSIGILLLITHILSSLTVGFLFRFWKYKSDNLSILNKNRTISQYVSIKKLGNIISESITSSLSSIFMIGGFIILFCVIISIMQSSGILKVFYYLLLPIFNFLRIDSSFINGFICGLFEITNGVSAISIIPVKNISINIIFSAFLLGFGGFSILLQVWSIISKADLSIKPYIIGKLLHGILAAFYTYLFISFIPWFNFDLL